MLPVCSATTCCSCHTQIPVHGGFKSSSPYSRTFDIYSSNFEKAFLNISNCGKSSVGRKYVSCSYHVGDIEQWGLVKTINPSLGQTGSYNLRELTLRRNGLIFVEDTTTISVADDQATDLITNTIYNVDIVQNYAESEPVTPSIDVTIEPPQVSESLKVDLSPLSGEGQNFGSIDSDTKESTIGTINKAQDALNNSLNALTSSVKMALKTANEAVDNVVNDIISFVSKSGDSAGSKLNGLTSELKEKSGRAGLIALDVLRGTIVVIEDTIVKGAKIAVYAYGSAKENLPLEFREVLSSSEDSVSNVLNPIGAGLQQVYIGVEGFEERLGLDPNDPLVPVILFLGVSATLWGSYRFLEYSGYAGDLSPESTFELLRGKEDAVLIDIRPEDLREKDGIPDLRRTARFRYASVTLPEVDGSVRKLLKGGRNVEDALLATVIRNLKIVNERSKVIVMDVDGSRSKGVARSLRKLGIKRPYLVQGGFRSWVNEGFRIKVLKPETALTILNEEAEAIIEEIKPTPLKLIGFGVGFAAAAYSLLEWETTLQYIGVIGLGLTVYWRFDSYQDAEDFKQDVSLLLAPARLGGQAISWASGKLEPTRNGLPTSPPSSSDVQSRVLQAAAKHESQSSDTEEEETQIRSSAAGENVNASEA